MKIIKKPSPNFSSRPEDVRIDSIILHYTGMKSFDEALERMCDPKIEVSAHYAVDYNGDVYQLVEEEKKAWHAGVSCWRGKKNVNENSIGIEIANLGHEFGYENFTSGQIESVKGLCELIKGKYNIVSSNIIGHSDVAPERKEDAGELFPWEKFAEVGLGIYHGVDVSNDAYLEKSFAYGDKGDEIMNIQKNLSQIGYEIEANGSFDKRTQEVIVAFYRRFFPERIKSQPNPRFPEYIKWDTKSEAIVSDLLEDF